MNTERALTRAFGPEELRIFVYGTLRKGGALESLLPLECERELGRAFDHALHYPYSHRSFPYLVPLEGVHTLGELIHIRLDDDEATHAFRWVDEMEQSAGYDRQIVRVSTAFGTVSALAWIWNDSFSIGERIKSDDWTQTPEWTHVDRSALR